MSLPLPVLLKTRKIAWLCTLCLVSWLELCLGTACSAERVEELPPEEIITRSVKQMKGLPGFHFVIDRSGAPAYLDYDKTLVFRRAEGDFVAPDQAWATVRVIAPGLVAEVKILCIGERYWETNLLTGEWLELPAGMGFNPAVLFDPEMGFQPVLESDLYDLKYEDLAELEETPGVKLYHLSGKLDGTRIFQMSYGMIGPGTLDAQIWVAPETFELYRTRIESPVPDEAEPVIWQIDFWDFGKVADIHPPGVTP